MSYSIAIIGTGASGVAAFVNIIEKMSKYKLSKYPTIYLIEKNLAQFSKGLAYNTNYSCNLINTPADTMGISGTNKADFIRWLDRNYNNSMISPSYTAFKYPYLPRSLYGAYLVDKMEENINEARDKGINVNFINAELKDIAICSDKYQLLFLNHSALLVNQAILCIGGYTKSPYKTLENKPGYYDSPYLNCRELECIPKDKTIGIIGSRLSAIDTTLMFRDNNHRGKIYLISRQGLIPSVHGDYEPDRQAYYLTKKNLDLITNGKRKSLKLEQLLELIKKEVIKSENVEINCDKLLSFHNRIEAWLKLEISKADNKVRSWQAALYSTNHLVNKIWGLLSIEDKKNFLQYIPIFMVYRAAMPITVAKSIYFLLKNKQLSILSGIENIIYNDKNANFEVAIKKEMESKSFTLTTDYIVNATGVFDELTDTIEQPLLRNLLCRGLIKHNNFLGIDMHHNNINPITKDGKVLEDFFIIGGLSKGTDLVSNLLEFIVAKANKISEEVIKLALLGLVVSDTTVVNEAHAKHIA